MAYKTLTKSHKCEKKKKCILIVDPVTRTCICLSKKLEKWKGWLKLEMPDQSRPPKKWKECGELGRMPHLSTQNAPLRG